MSGTLTFKVGQSLAYIPLLITPDRLRGESKAIPIVRTGGGGTILTVNWQAISGTTSEAFSPTSGSVTFAANETIKSFTIEIGNCGGECSDVTAVFALSAAPAAGTIGASNRATLTILGSGEGRARD